MQTDLSDILETFKREFGGGDEPVRVVRAPGRVNLIGEHTDYNDGFVCPLAIEPEVRLAFRVRSDELIRLASTAFPGQVVEISLNEPIAAGNPTWANYSRGVAAELLKAGIPLVGMDAMIANSLPLGSGLSSSAAIEVATARALLAAAGSELAGDKIALVCQKAEHKFAGVPVGIMDPMVVATARPGCAMLLDCRSLERTDVPLDPADVRVVIMNSMVRHELSGSEYADRRRQCEEGVELFRAQNPAIRALRDVSMELVEAAKVVLPEVVYMRCRHVVSENNRATRAAALITEKQYAEAGRLMLQSHESLRDDYEVSTAELDFLVGQAMQAPGVYGARMTGGGFGGCIVALVKPSAAPAVITRVKTAFEKKFGIVPECYETVAAGAAGLVD